MSNAIFTVPSPKNEEILKYLPHSTEKEALKKEYEKQSSEVLSIPLIIGGKEVFTNTRIKVSMPHDKNHIIAEACIGGPEELKAAVEAATAAKESWECLPWDQRAAIFLKCADLISTKYRARMNAATMIGQSKNIYQAEIDASCEAIDFLRYNAHFAQEIYKQQPCNSDGIWNKLEYLPLEGFVVSITPFNFTAIGSNLCCAPALMGNTVVWKPSTNALVSNYHFMRILMEAGLPDGVLNFVPSKGSDVSKHVLTDARLGGVHFTGSTKVFRQIWSDIGNNIANYKSYPRLVGETGGKDFVFAHPSADVEALSTALVRGSFEYQGQKCSAASRAFIPQSIWSKVEASLREKMSNIRIGDVSDFRNLMGAVIDKASFEKIKGYIDQARTSNDEEVLIGGICDDSVGWFIHPTVIKASTPFTKTMTEEIFGPVLAIYVYKDDEIDAAIHACDTASPYGLTGAIFANDRYAVATLSHALRKAAGNFYINDKPTGAVVGQQPFGGARASGTNDKAGSIFNLQRWVSMRATKETLVPIYDVDYPYMIEE